MTKPKVSGVAIILCNGVQAGKELKLRELLAAIGLSSATWNVTELTEVRELMTVAHRAASCRAVIALVFLGDFPGRGFEKVKGMLEANCGPFKVLQANQGDLAAVVDEVKKLLPHRSILSGLTRGLLGNRSLPRLIGGNR